MCKMKIGLNTRRVSIKRCCQNIFFGMNFRAGQMLVVEGLRAECKLGSYLAACGFVRNSSVRVLAVSPLRKTLLLAVNDSVISLKTSVLDGVMWKK